MELTIMPQLNEILTSPNRKKFKKKNYRPWNQEGDAPQDLSNADAKNNTNLPKSEQPSVLSTSSESDTMQNDQPSVKDIVHNPSLNVESAGRISSSAKELNDSNKNNDKYNDKLIDNYSDTSKASGSGLTDHSRLEHSVDNHLIVNYVADDADPLKPEHKIRLLSGHQKKLFLLITRSCVDNGKLTSDVFFSDQLKIELNTTIGTIYSSIRRLEDKKLIKSISKRARGGYMRFQISSEIKELVKQLLRNNI